MCEFCTVSTDETIMGQMVELTMEKVLELIESAYPNPVTVEDMAKWVVSQLSRWVFLSKNQHGLEFY